MDLGQQWNPHDALLEKTSTEKEVGHSRHLGGGAGERLKDGKEARMSQSDSPFMPDSLNAFQLITRLLRHQFSSGCETQYYIYTYISVWSIAQFKHSREFCIEAYGFITL